MCQRWKGERRKKNPLKDAFPTVGLVTCAEKGREKKLRFRASDQPVNPLLHSLVTSRMLACRWSLDACLRTAAQTKGPGTQLRTVSTNRTISSMSSVSLPRSSALFKEASWIQRRHLRQMTTPELRKEFTEFFVKEHGHVAVKSSSLIPHNDKSLMFTNAGNKEKMRVGSDTRAVIQGASRKHIK